MITKGAVNNVLQVCTKALQNDGSVISIDTAQEKITALYKEKSSQGFRMIGVSYTGK